MNVTQVLCGGNHTLLLLDDKRVFAMGNNEFGQLGIPEEECETTDRLVISQMPVEIKSLNALDIAELACGM